MAVKVINILKDGTIVEDMSTVKVPREIVLRVYDIVRVAREKERERERKERRNERDKTASAEWC